MQRAAAAIAAEINCGVPPSWSRKIAYCSLVFCRTISTNDNMFRARIHNGKMSMMRTTATRWEQWKRGNEGAEVVIELFKDKRSSRQHRYYFAYLAIISKETGDDVPSLHAFFKKKFLPPVIKTVMGEEVQFAPSTQGLDKAQFSEFLDRICALTGVPLPDVEAAGYVNEHKARTGSGAPYPEMTEELSANQF